MCIERVIQMLMNQESTWGTGPVPHYKNASLPWSTWCRLHWRLWAHIAIHMHSGDVFDEMAKTSVAFCRQQYAIHCDWPGFSFFGAFSPTRQSVLVRSIRISISTKYCMQLHCGCRPFLHILTREVAYNVKWFWCKSYGIEGCWIWIVFITYKTATRSKEERQ